MKTTIALIVQGSNGITKDRAFHAIFMLGVGLVSKSCIGNSSGIRYCISAFLGIFTPLVCRYFIRSY